jgi:hypothetical protein
MLVVLFITVCTVQAQSITVLSMGFGKDFINGQPLINANFIIKNAYASYSLSIDNTVKSYDIGWTFRVKNFYFAPTLGVTCVNKTEMKRYYLQNVTDENITITEINVNAENGNTVINNPAPPIVLQGSAVISVIDRIEANTKNHPNVGVFVGYQFNDGLTLFLKGTNNSFGFGMGYIIGSMF